MEALWQGWERKAAGDHLHQVEALRKGSVLCLLSSFRLIRVEGEDAAAFLQGQLSSDVRELGAERAQYSSYSSAKGRMLASFLAWMRDGAYYLMVSSDIAEAVAKRLSMFVLRSKVKIAIVDWTLLGLSGKQACNLLQGAAGQAVLHVVADEESMRVALPGGGFILVLRGSGALAERLAASPELTAICPEVWGLRDIDAGIPWVALATQEQFVPQMANMELIGAVNFKKGCYPGQEIVARTQYLGKLKRRMFRVSLPVSAAVGAKLYCPDTPGQAIGMLAALCQVADGRYEGLAVAQLSAWESGIFLEDAHVTRLERLELPYSLAE